MAAQQQRGEKQQVVGTAQDVAGAQLNKGQKTAGRRLAEIKLHLRVCLVEDVLLSVAGWRRHLQHIGRCIGGARRAGAGLGGGVFRRLVGSLVRVGADARAADADDGAVVVAKGRAQRVAQQQRARRVSTLPVQQQRHPLVAELRRLQPGAFQAARLAVHCQREVGLQQRAHLPGGHHIAGRAALHRCGGGADLGRRQVELVVGVAALQVEPRQAGAGGVGGGRQGQAQQGQTRPHQARQTGYAPAAASAAAHGN